MPVIVPSPQIDGLQIVQPTIYQDSRGSFFESFRAEWFDPVISPPMVQSNTAFRVAGTLVGIHWHPHQTDYWTIPKGHVKIGLVDLRPKSSTFKNTLIIDHIPSAQGYLIPEGVGHGFYAMTDMTIQYLVNQYYGEQCAIKNIVPMLDQEQGLMWDSCGIHWGVANPSLSERDMTNPQLETVLELTEKIFT